MKSRKRNQPANFAAPEPASGAAFRWAADDHEGLPAAESQAATLKGAFLDPPSPLSAVVAGAQQLPMRRDDEEREAWVEDDFEAPPGWPVYLIAFGVSLLWVLGPLAFAVGYRNGVEPFRNEPFAMAVFALLAIGPAMFIWGAAYVVRQGQKLAAESRRAKAQADEMLTPMLAAAARAGDVSAAVRGEIARAGAAAVDARESLLALREALANETEKLVDAAQASQRTALQLAGALGAERTEMAALGQSLDGQAARVTEAITEQARMVAQAADLAETQLREAEASLSARAADLVAAGGQAGDAARTAGEDLTRHIARLETAGVGVAEQVRACEGGLSEQRAALTALAQSLKTDNAGFTEEAEAHATRLTDFIAQARLSSMEMSDRATKGGESLRQLMADAAGQFRELAEMARAEREAFGQSTAQALDAVSQAAGEQRSQLEEQTHAAIEALSAAAQQTRDAAAQHAGLARTQVDELSEAAFAAGEKANQVLEARLEEARALVEQSSRMAEEAGLATARRLEDGAAAARASLEELKAMLAEVEVRAAKLPQDARAQVELVQASVADGMDELMAQARRTAQEAEAIDGAFQERVRRNFEMLSEAVRLMGVTAALPPARPEAPAPAPEVEAPERPARTRTRAPAFAAPAEEPPPERLRLRLAPTATDEEFSAVFEAAGGQDPGEPETEDEEPWTWKDLLASLDGPEADGRRLEDTLGAELAAMGVEPGKLLSRDRIGEIAAAVQSGDIDGARLVVSRLAPAATRRIGRRLFTDEALKRQVETYVRRYQTLVDDTVVRDPEGVLLTELLAADGGKLYLVLDTAAGDLA